MKRPACIVGVLLFAWVSGARASLIGVDAIGPDELYSINESTAAVTSIGPLAFGFSPDGVHGLAYDRNNDIVYASEFFMDSLYTLNQSTGAATVVGSFGLSTTAILGLAFDPNTGTLFGSATGDETLVTINTSTGAPTAVGSGYGVAGAFPSVRGLAFDPNSNTLYGSDTSTDQLLSIDPSTGLASVIGLFNLSNSAIEGLAFDPLTNTLFGSNPHGGGLSDLVTINTGTGQATAVGPLPFGSGFNGLTVNAVVPEPSTWLLLATGLAAIAIRRRR